MLLGCHWVYTATVDLWILPTTFVSTQLTICIYSNQQNSIRPESDTPERAVQSSDSCVVGRVQRRIRSLEPLNLFPLSLSSPSLPPCTLHMYSTPLPHKSISRGSNMRACSLQGNIHMQGACFRFDLAIDACGILTDQISVLFLQIPSYYMYCILTLVRYGTRTAQDRTGQGRRRDPPMHAPCCTHYSS